MKFNLEIKNNKQLSIFTYKILHDILLLTLIAYFLAFALEGVLPGMVSQNNGFIILNVIVFICVFSIVSLGSKLGISYEGKPKHNFFPIILIGAFFLVSNSLLKFTLWENLIITVTLMILYYLVHQLIFSPEE